MKTLLRIDTSARTQGSHSRALTGHYQTRWLAAHPGGRVIPRDLARDPIPHLDQATIDALYAAKSSGSPSPASALSDTLIAELFSVDAIVIGAPLYNSGIASTLKAYLDHVVRSGRTFSMDAQGNFTGLLTGKTVTIVTARGGSVADSNTADASDFQTPYLTSILAFIGLTDVTQIRLAGTALPGAQRDENLARARAQIDALFTSDRSATTAAANNNNSASFSAEPEWIGPFTTDDRRAISELRAAQAAAVATGDVERYTSLVADDVHWMFPGRDVVTGRTRFLEAQRNLRNGSAKILSMRKTPLRVERAGNLAIEIGRQELVVAPSENSKPTYPPQQKYTHIFRKTPAGWRFAVLMSNSSS
jgi:FMN-dependent NADH-azoreductase